MSNTFLTPAVGICALFALFLAAATVRSDLPAVADLKANADLPDPLVMLDGQRVTTKEQWIGKRRPELKELFQHYVYGQFPPRPEKQEFKVERVDSKALGGKATLKEVTISLGSAGSPRIHLLLFVPNKRNGPAPVFVGLNFCGNHTLVNDPEVRLPTSWLPNHCPGVKDNKATDAGRGKDIDVWAIEQTIDRGYAVATVYCGDVEPDRPDAADGVRAWLRKQGKGSYDWGTIAAWAWGIQRVIDYLVTDPDIDARRIIVVGHSRLGKTALLAAAFDERIALAIPLQAGCGGTAPSRGKVGESVKQINDRFPHWFNAHFKEFNDRPERLPLDQHCLVALVAPRPVLFCNAVEDTWANPVGQLEVLKAAAPVYRLLGGGSLDAREMPATGKLIDSTLGYYIRPGWHSMTAGDWRIFMDFADRHLGRP
jgi:(4-O-methyl)-D-glucuronate---lignin esterase